MAAINAALSFKICRSMTAINHVLKAANTIGPKRMEKVLIQCKFKVKNRINWPVSGGWSK